MRAARPHEGTLTVPKFPNSLECADASNETQDILLFKSSFPRKLIYINLNFTNNLFVFKFRLVNKYAG